MYLFFNIMILNLKMFKLVFHQLYKVILYFLIVIICSGGNFLITKGQNPEKFDHISVEDGLSFNTVYSITRDSLGFM